MGKQVLRVVFAAAGSISWSAQNERAKGKLEAHQTLPTEVLINGLPLYMDMHGLFHFSASLFHLG